MDAVVALWGLSLLRSEAIDNPRTSGTSAASSVELYTLGIRYWLNGRFGVDAGMGFFLLAPDAVTPAEWGVAPLIGVPIALVQWRNLTAYVKPQVSAFFVRFDSSTNRYQMAIAALGGAEIHLGWLHLPAVSLAFESGAEMAFFGGRIPGESAAGNSFAGYSLRPVELPTLEGLYKNVALRIYF